MTSQLASQLQRLQQRPVDTKRLTDSFLFNKSDAHSFSREQILELASAGLQTLVAMDNRFHPFIEALFTSAKVRQERSRLSAEENRSLDRTLDHFLTLLSPHLFLTAAQQVFEYLVRVYEVHVYNVQAVLRAFLPYHDHNLFARALLLLDLRDTGFDFLAKNQERGAPLLREHLVLACAESRKVLRLVCLTMALPVRLKVANHAANALFASVATALATHADAEALWRVLLPFVVEFLSGAFSGAEVGSAEGQLFRGDEGEDGGDGLPLRSAAAAAAGGSTVAATDREAVCTALVTLATWSTEVKFSVQMLTVVMRPILSFLQQATAAGSAPGAVVVASVSDLLALLEVLFHTQYEAVTQLPFTAHLNALLALPWSQWTPLLSAEVAESEAAGVLPFGAVVSVLVQHCLQRIAMSRSVESVPSDVWRFLQSAAEDVPMSDRCVERIVQGLMSFEDTLFTNKAAAEAGNNSISSSNEQEQRAAPKTIPEVDGIVSALERRYQRVFDATLAKLLETDSSASGSAASFLSRHLRGTRYEVLDVPAATGVAGGRPVQLPLFACMLHPLPGVRRLAANALSSMSLEQLTSSSSSSSSSSPSTATHSRARSNTGGGSLLELLAHVAQYETDGPTATLWMRAAAAALAKLVAATAESESSDAAGRPTAYYVAAVKGLLGALRLLVSLHGSATQFQYFALVLQPLLSQLRHLCPTDASATPSKKAKRSTPSLPPPPSSLSASPSSPVAVALKSLRSAVLYHTVLLYVTVASAPADVVQRAETQSFLHSVEAALQIGTPEALPRALTLFPTGKSVPHPASTSNEEGEEVDDEDGAESDSDTEAKKPTLPTATSTVLSVWECTPLLQAIHDEAQERLPATLAAVRSTLCDAAASAEQATAASLECTVALAASLVCGQSDKSGGETGAEAGALSSYTATTLLRFLVGSSVSSTGSEVASTTQMSKEEQTAAAGQEDGDSRGYLGVLQQVQRAAARQAISSGAEPGASVVVGRNAPNRVFTTAYLPSNDVTNKLGAVVRAVLRVALQHASSPSARHVSSSAPSSHASATAVAAPDTLLSLLQILGFLGTPLPTLSEAPAVLPHALLRLLELNAYNDDDDATAATSGVEASAGSVFTVDWVGLVHAAVYGPAAKPTTVSPTTEVSLGALAVTLFLPLRAPLSLRERWLQTLQDAVLRSATGATEGGKPRTKLSSSSPGASAVSSAQLVLRAAMAQPAKVLHLSSPLSITTLSAVVESMAREESRFQLTAAATELLGVLLGAAATSATGEVIQTSSSASSSTTTTASVSSALVPDRLAGAVVEHFFAVPDPLRGGTTSSSGSSKKRESAQKAAVPLPLLMPRLLRIIHANIAGAGATTKSLSSSSSAAGTAAPVSASAADLLELVCRRLVLRTDTDAVTQWCVALLQHPYLRVLLGRGGASGQVQVRRVYRHALNILAAGLQQGLEAAAATQSVIFSANKTAKSGAESEADATQRWDAVVKAVTPVLVTAVSAVGADVAQFFTGTLAGYQRFFLPLLSSAVGEKSSAKAVSSAPSSLSRQQMLEVMAELVETMAPRSTAVQGANEEGDGKEATPELRWQAPSGCAISNPLHFAQAMQLVTLCEAPAGATEAWPRTRESILRLRLLSAVLRVSPAVRCDDDEDDESLYHLVQAMAHSLPLEAMAPLLAGTSFDSVDSLATLPGSSRLFDVYSRHVLTLLRELVSVCQNQSSALCEKDPRGVYKLRGTLVKQSLVLMASLLLLHSEEDELQQPAKDAAGEAADDISRQRVDVIAELLRVLAPLLMPSPSSAPHSTAAAATSEAGFLHIPIVALLIRMESAEFTEALRYRSAAEVCQEILTSFDIRTQLTCLSQLMRLVMDPQSQLTDTAGVGSTEMQQQQQQQEEVVHLFRRMVKPNQIINRQETILHLITTTVKSEGFLGPFIALQHSSSGSGKGSRAKPGAEDGDEHKGEGEEGEEAAAADGTRTDDACMHLLVNAMELFSHYSDLNESTPNDAVGQSAVAAGRPPRGGADGDASDAVIGEQKGYVMLLELLAGNTLACVLAGINEPTFVHCLHRLLTNPRVSLQLKGLEVLLDRLHHSLPTVEHALSEEEMEEHRRNLRDPKKKLTMMDLVRIKARPLTTKRSFALLPHITTLLSACMKSALDTTRKVTVVSSGTVTLRMPLSALPQLYHMCHLCVACTEELIRIVGSGGSLQAEKTLLNVNRSKRVTESVLYKLFGNKGRVNEVHDYVTATCESMMPQLSQALLTLLHTTSSSTAAATANEADAHPSSSRAAAHGESTALSAVSFRAVAEEGLLSTMSCLLTSLGTVTQVLGTAFTAPHCSPLLQTILSAAVYQVVELPPTVTRGAAGSLLRHTTLSCFIRCFPACWQMSQPYLPRALYAATHLTNVDDAECGYLSSEVLTVLEAVMDTEMFLEACTECLRGIRYVNSAVLSGAAQQAAMLLDSNANGEQQQRQAAGTTSKRSRQLRLQVGTHSFALFFQCVQRRVQGLKKEDLLRLSFMMEGSTPQNNFWLAALQALATAPTVPSSEVTGPVLDAFTSFFVKFKAKHCTKLLHVVAEWAFGGDSSTFAKAVSSPAARGAKGSSDSENEGSTSEEDDAAQDAGRGNRLPTSRTTVHRWLLFYALFNHLLEMLGAIFDFGYPVALPYVVTTLSSYCSANRSEAKPLGPLIAQVLEGALESTRRMSLAQTPGPDYDHSIPFDVFFATPEVFNALMPALIHQLTNLAYLSDDAHDYGYRAEKHVIPAIRAFFACLNSSKLQSKTQAELIRGLRHPSRHVRRTTLLCLDGVYADGGQELAARLMAEMLPSVVELTEDRDDAVVEEARKLCNNLSHMTGQDVLHAMS